MLRSTVPFGVPAGTVAVMLTVSDTASVEVPPNPYVDLGASRPVAVEAELVGVQRRAAA
jgi:hypothetical protein